MNIRLNDQQEQAANHVDGPCLVVSVPGSGKTRLLVERTARLIEGGVSPSNIVCVTFTNKAADEMKERICSRLGIDTPKCYVGTFHALCALILRKYGTRLGYSESFTIADSDDQLDLIRQCSRVYENPVEKKEAWEIANAVNNWRENMWDRQQYEDILYNHQPLIDIGDLYLERLKRNDSVDFSGLLYETINLLEQEEQIKARIQDRCRYLQIDECQDTNFAQFYLINQFSAKYNNVFMVGDISQCVVGNTLVKTREGFKEISQIAVGEEVACASGRGKMEYGIVTRTYESEAKGLVKVETSRGYILTATPEHVFFADFKLNNSLKHFVYVMYKEGLGFRVGTTRTYSNNSNHGRMGYATRSLGEMADKVWVVKVCDTEKDARYWEQYFSVTYGLPTWTFRVHSKNKNSYGDREIFQLFSSIDTESNAKKMFDVLGIDIQYPHYMPKAMSKVRRRNFSVTLCADNRHKPLHSYSISGSDMNDAETLNNIGIKTRASKKGVKGWRVEGSRADLGYIKRLYEEVSSVMDVNLIEQARFSDRSLSFLPASNLLEGMSVFVCEDGEIIEDEIVNITRMDATEKVYDIDVDRFHNFVGNGIVTHNSIYRFRGARYQNIQDFVNKHSNCVRIELPLNYRSTPQIVGVADKLIKNNASHMAKDFIATKPDGDDVQCIKMFNEIEEGRFVARQVKRLMDEGGWDPGDVAVLYRMNSMTEPVERALANENIKYKIVGGRSFYNRKEIKDSIAMLKLITNPKDGIAFHRVAALFKGMGDVTIGKIEALAEEKDVSLLEATGLHEETESREDIQKACRNIVSCFNSDFSEFGPDKCLDKIIKDIKYFNYLEDAYETNWQERAENVNELIGQASLFVETHGASNIKYLQSIALITSSDEKSNQDTVTLMTLHASKGLEFPIVFMIGVEEDVLPHGMTLGEDPIEGVEEERRLCYVGMTRAERLLYVTYCSQRRRRGFRGFYDKKCKPSRYLFESGILKKDIKYG